MSDVDPVFWESGLEIKPVYGPEELEKSGGVKDFKHRRVSNAFWSVVLVDRGEQGIHLLDR